MKDKNILWVTPKWTLPAIDGARVATDRLVKHMSDQGAVLDVACLGLQGEKRDELELKRQWKANSVVHMSRNLPSGMILKSVYYGLNFFLRPNTPLTMSSFKDKKVRRFLDEVLKGKVYDWLVLDGLHLGACWVDSNGFNKPSNVGKVLYRAHNIEQTLWEGAQGKIKFGPYASFIRNQRKKVAAYEEAIIKGCDLVAPISKEDQEWIRKRYPDKNTVLALLGMDFSKPLKSPLKKDKVHLLFIGKLDWPPNKDGLEWFLKNVWPFLDKSRFQLHIAGSGSGKWLDSYKNTAALKIHGFVENLDVLYAECHLTIAPLFYGSGTRIKVIESYTKGRAVITTKVGAQGSGLCCDTDFFLAQSARDWVDTLEKMEAEDALRRARAGRLRLQAEYDEKSVSKKLYDKLL